ncbi:hypothetical protein C8T65DRAFT_520794, partial [Cerioporus squamosus]
IMREHGAVISGSTALHYFLDDEDWTPNDLDIYVADANWDSFISAIQAPNGLNLKHTESEYVSGDDDDDDDGERERARAAVKGLRAVRRFYTASGKKIDVIRSPSNNSITPLHFFWSTIVMNYLTPDACVCGYPTITFRRFGILK